jgi:hypothetical protein
MASIASSQTQQVAFGKIPQAVLIAGVGGAIINTILWIIGNAVGGMKLPLLPVAGFSVIGVAIGGVLFWLLGKFTKKPFTIFTIVAVVFLVLYAFAPPSMINAPPAPGMEAFNTTTVVVLEIMHIVSGGLAIWAFTRFARA